MYHILFIRCICQLLLVYKKKGSKKITLFLILIPDDKPLLEPSKLLKRIAFENIPMDLWSSTAKSACKL